MGRQRPPRRGRAPALRAATALLFYGYGRPCQSGILARGPAQAPERLGPIALQARALGATLCRGEVGASGLPGVEHGSRGERLTSRSGESRRRWRSPMGGTPSRGCRRWSGRCKRSSYHLILGHRSGRRDPGRLQRRGPNLSILAPARPPGAGASPLALSCPRTSPQHTQLRSQALRSMRACHFHAARSGRSRLLIGVVACESRRR